MRMTTDCTTFSAKRTQRASFSICYPSDWQFDSLILLIMVIKNYTKITRISFSLWLLLGGCDTGSWVTKLNQTKYMYIYVEYIGKNPFIVRDDTTCVHVYVHVCVALARMCVCYCNVCCTYKHSMVQCFSPTAQWA